MLRGKKVLLGVTGSIAAYKSAFLTRLLITAGAEVKVVLTPAASDFVTPLTLSTLSKNPVYSKYVENEEEGTWTNHVDLGLWADLMIIAPATSNTLSKMASGECDNLLMGVYMSAKCPVYFAPAMDLDMYAHPTTKANIDKLQSFGNILIAATSGELASGLVGEGRMAEPEDIVAFIEKDLLKSAPLYGKKVLINGGPTYEPIDSVRFIGNHSSGKMAHSLAKIATSLGAEVTLVLGPTQVPFDFSGLKAVRVTTAREMYDAMHQRYQGADYIICSAAVSDFRPAVTVQKKIKKDQGVPTIELVENPDILSSLGQVKKNNQKLIGFALETENEKEYARKKLVSKNLDAVVMNTLRDSGAGFGHDTNKVYVYTRDEQWTDFDLNSKEIIAQNLWKLFITL